MANQRRHLRRLCLREPVDQQVLTGTLTTLPELQEQAKLPAPALIIVGEVVLLHEDLAWFGDDVLQNHGLVLPDANQ